MTARALRPLWHRTHLFPHKRIKKKVCRASVHYTCQANPADMSMNCLGAIVKGSDYLRVSIMPPKHEGGRWITIQVCSVCAIDLGLATGEPPE